jgi:polar amino acid transport system substrate-binding protein
MGIAARKDSAVKTLADLNGKIVGVLSGSTGETWTKEHQQEHGISEVKGYNTQQDLLLDLTAGRVDAVVSDVPGMQYAFKKMTDLEVRERIKTGEQYGLMMTKDHPLLGKINDALTEMKKDGTMQSIHEKWFGTKAMEGSATITEAPMPKA